jgi:hypothetical protein
MRSSHAIVIWLLELLGLDAALTGDLLEERARGRSAIWYWRQVLVAIWVGIWVAIREHKVLALRAVATGFAIEFLFIFLWNRAPELQLPRFSIAAWMIQFSVTLLTQVATGWVVARTHRAHQIPMVLVFLVCFHIWFTCGNFSWVRMVLVDSIDQPRFRPYLVMYLMTIFTETVGLLLGGILGARPKRSSQAI